MPTENREAQGLANALPWHVPQSAGKGTQKAVHLMLDESVFNTLKIYSCRLKERGCSDGTVAHVINALVYANLPSIAEAASSDKLTLAQAPKEAPHEAAKAVAPKRARKPKAAEKLTPAEEATRFSEENPVGTVMVDTTGAEVTVISEAKESANGKFATVQIDHARSGVVGPCATFLLKSVEEEPSEKVSAEAPSASNSTDDEWSF